MSCLNFGLCDFGTQREEIKEEDRQVLIFHMMPAVGHRPSEYTHNLIQEEFPP